MSSLSNSKTYSGPNKDCVEDWSTRVHRLWHIPPVAGQVLSCKIDSKMSSQAFMSPNKTSAPDRFSPHPPPWSATETRAPSLEALYLLGFSMCTERWSSSVAVCAVSQNQSFFPQTPGFVCVSLLCFPSSYSFFIASIFSLSVDK